MNKLGEDFSIEDTMNIGTAVRLGIGDLPSGPEPGPRMPKKKRPKFL